MIMSFSPLRPYPISKMRVVPDEIEKPDWALDVSSCCFKCLFLHSMHAVSSHQVIIPLEVISLAICSFKSP